MHTTKIRQQLHDFIDAAEDKKLKAIYILLEGDIADNYNLSDYQKQELDIRYSNFQNNVGSNFTLQEMVIISDEALKKKKV